MKIKWHWAVPVLMCILLTAPLTMAVPTYNMLVTGGAVCNNNAAAYGWLNSQGKTPEFSINPPTPPNKNTWDVAGYWEFKVDSSTGSDWNDVFDGGTWYFNITWDGSIGGVKMPPASFNKSSTWDNMYDQWFRNNDGVYTYFKLNVEETSPQASSNATGVFAFILDLDTGSSPYGGFDKLPAGTTGGLTGTGVATAVQTPEPSMMLLFGLGLMGITGIKLRKR